MKGKKRKERGALSDFVARGGSKFEVTPLLVKCSRLHDGR